MRYCFDDFVVDTRLFYISRAGRRLAIRPKVFALLCHLIEHRDRVVTKQELLDVLWQEQHVDDFAVSWTVSHARRVLGQPRGARGPIQTLHTRGYRFVAELIEVRADPEAPAAESAPTVAAARATSPFVGREHLMRRLEGSLARAWAGAGSCSLLVGEAGIGKTRCMDELALRATSLGFGVWTGRSVEATYGPVFGPWIQILRALASSHPALAETGQTILARLTVSRGAASSLATMNEGGEPHTQPAVEYDRFWQYDAIANLLQQAAQERPMLLMFDDLHSADTGTWELLEFLTPQLRRLPILVVGARREDGRASSRDPRAQPLRDVERIELGALDALDVAQYLRLLTGVEQPNRALCEAVESVSLGNPWFMHETLRALSTRYAPEALATLDASAVRPADTAMEVLRARVMSLELYTREVLAAASVLGQSFEIGLLSRMQGGELDRVLQALDVAHAAGMVSLESSQRARFHHGLLRSVVYDDLAIAERLRLHRAAAVALEETLDPLHYGEVAYHYQRSLPLSDTAHTAAAALRAADLALRAQAFTDAAAFLAWATLAQSNDARVQPRERAELWLRRAYTERLGGHEAQARASATNVIELARQHGYHDLLVRAARVLRFSHALAGTPDALALSALQEALQRCPETASEERVGALSLLSWLPPQALDMTQSKASSAAAVTLALSLDSPTALREALHARLYALSGPDDIDALLTTADALLAVPGVRPVWIGFEALWASYRAHLYRSDVVAADATLSALGREGIAHGLTEVVWHYDFFRAQRVFSTGDFAKSELLFADLKTRGQRLGLSQSTLLSTVAHSLLTCEQQGLTGLEQGASVEGMLDTLLALPACYAATGARFAAELGRLSLAREILHQLSQRDFAPVSKDLGYVNTLANLSVVAIVLGDRARAKTLYGLLAPYPQHNTPNGMVGFYEGSASRFLAGLAAFLGEHARAKRHFDDALVLNEQLGALPQVARTCYEYARWLLQKERNAAARPLKQRAIDLADRLGMRQLAAFARSLVP